MIGEERKGLMVQIFRSLLSISFFEASVTQSIVKYGNYGGISNFQNFVLQRLHIPTLRTSEYKFILKISSLF